MKKLENYSNCLRVLKNADFSEAENNEIYRTGIIGQYDLTFELSWKAMQEVLQLQGVTDFRGGFPRDILQAGYRFGLFDDETLWLMMLKKRNLAIHVYNEDEINEMVHLIRDSFIPAFVTLEKTLKEKTAEAEKDSL